jgi:class 3 adenylate cyclase
MTLGTPEYLSPEQALAQPLDARTDLYSLSVVAYRMLSGRLPFASEDARQLLSQHINLDPPPLQQLRPELSAFPALVACIHRGLSKRREDRFESADAFATSLESAEKEARTGAMITAPDLAALAATGPGPTTGPFKPVTAPGRIRSENLTVVFTDIKDFTARTSRQSREENHRILELHDRLLQPVFEGYGGRVVKTIGDAFLVVFGSPTNAVLCAMGVQDRLAEHNASAPPNEKLDVRVAINLGEVTQSKGDVFGDPVNVAARLEGITEAGEIYFTEAVFLAMNRSEVPHELVGVREMRGVDIAIKVYKVKRDPLARLPFGGAALEPLREKLRRIERRELLSKRLQEGRQAGFARARAWGEWLIDGAVHGPTTRRLQAAGVGLGALIALGGLGWGLSQALTRSHPAPAPSASRASPALKSAPEASPPPEPPPAPASETAREGPGKEGTAGNSEAQPSRARAHRTPADEIQSFMDDLIPPKRGNKKAARSTGHEGKDVTR